MTLGEFIMESPIKNKDVIRIVKHSGDITLTRRGNLMQDHILEFSEDEVIGYQWSKEKGWTVEVTDPLPFC
jgi:hypothetical protein